MLSQKIYTLRRKQGLSQEQLAEKIGVSRQAVSKWESGTATPELEKLIALSECFHISLDELVKEHMPESKKGEGHRAEAKESKKTGVKIGIGLLLIGAVCLVLSGIMMLTGLGTGEQYHAVSTITLSAAGGWLIVCVLFTIVGVLLILRKK